VLSFLERHLDGAPLTQGASAREGPAQHL